MNSVQRLCSFVFVVMILLIIQQNQDSKSRSLKDVEQFGRNFITKLEENFVERDEHLLQNRKSQQKENTDPVSFDCIKWTPVRIEMPEPRDFIQKQETVEEIEETAEHRKESFVKVYAEGQWGSDVKSGPGSLMSQSVRMREILGIVVDKLKEQMKVQQISILDSSCGDMTWMPTFLAGRTDVAYTGFDIVPSNIENHKKNFSNLTFKVHDIVSEPLPESYDLVISRHTTIHLKNGDVKKAVKNFINSGSKYLLTTTYPNITENVELSEDDFGRYRPINLMLPPILLPVPLCITKDSDHDADYMALWELKALKNL